MMKRLVLEIILVSAVIYLGWDKAFRDWLPNSEPSSSVVAKPAGAGPRPFNPPQPAWMNDPNHRSVLDTPRPGLAHSAESPGKPGSWLFDPNHHATLDPPQHASATPH
jgi:hypothetical protein